jgi:hypothetical protein
VKSITNLFIIPESEFKALSLIDQAKKIQDFQSLHEYIDYFISIRESINAFSLYGDSIENQSDKDEFSRNITLLFENIVKYSQAFKSESGDIELIRTLYSQSKAILSDLYRILSKS